MAKQLTAINCGDWTRRPGALLEQLGVTTVVFHGGLFRDNPAAPDTAAFAWNALARHGYRPQAEDRPVTLLTRRGGGPPPPSPVADPPRDVAQFCDGWRPNDGEGRVTSPHASLWAYNAGGVDLRLFLRRDREPANVRISADGRRGQNVIVGGLLRETRAARRRRMAPGDARRYPWSPGRRLRAQLAEPDYASHQMSSKTPVISPATTQTTVATLPRMTNGVPHH